MSTSFWTGSHERLAWPQHRSEFLLRYACPFLLIDGPLAGLHALRKRPGPGREHFITVGRVLTDIILVDHRISRAHAGFHDTIRGYTVTDLGSKNGTWLAGRRCAAFQPALLYPGDRLSFAGVEGNFLTNELAWRWLAGNGLVGSR